MGLSRVCDMLIRQIVMESRDQVHARSHYDVISYAVRAKFPHVAWTRQLVSEQFLLQLSDEED